jgi:mRNA interferase RelE/StbE
MNPLYEIYLERAAEKDLKKLSLNVFQRIIAQIKSLGENPRPQGCRKIIGTKQSWRIRSGDYRIIYEIDEKLRRVNILRVRIRREAYR